MGWLAEKLGKKASEKATQLYNAGVRKRNEIVKNLEEKHQKEKELKQRLKKVEREAYEKERYKQAIAKGKRKAKQGSGATRILTGLGKTAELMFPEFAPKKKASSRRSSGTTITLGDGTTIRVSKKRKKKKKDDDDFFKSFL